ncbi:MAG: hypothetical protein ACLQNE_18770 [Thermoguttaceae bacterium]
MRSRTAKSGRSYLQTQARWGALAEGGSIVVKWWAVATVLALVGTALPPAAGQVETALYAKKETLPQTLLESRARLHAWQARQRDALAAVRPGEWYWASSGGATPDPETLTRRGIAADRAAADGRLRWVKCPADRFGDPLLGPSPADYLFTTVAADRAVLLTFELSRHEGFGGFGYRPPGSAVGEVIVWLNGRRVAADDRLQGYARVPVAKRRGWHDAVLIDLPLDRGENRLMVVLGKGAQASWFNAARFHPEPAAPIWAMVENDFPRSGNRLLQRVDYAWFDPADGWLAQRREPRYERQLLKSLIDELGADGGVIRRRQEDLTAAAAQVSDPRWLDLCVTAAEFSAALRELAGLVRAVDALSAAYPDRYPGVRFRQVAAGLRRRLAAKAATRIDPAERETSGLLDALRQLRRSALVTENPLLAGKRLLLIKRFTYDSYHYYDEFIQGIGRFGGCLCTVSLQDRSATPIAPQLSGGLFDRYDLSFDGRRIVFDYKPSRPGGFRIYEVETCGGGLRQITFPPEDEQTRIRTYSLCSWDELQRQPHRYGHWTDDMHPCYLPDGRIVFTSTRSERGVLCGGHELTVTNLYRVDADGTGLVQLSQGALSEFCPSVMNDGRILYNRWEYVDKGAGAAQGLWAMFPDGSRSEEIFGNQIGLPSVFTQARHVPGCTDKLICLGTGHSPANQGAILLVDLHQDKRSRAAMTALTPECVTQAWWGLYQLRNGRWREDFYGPWYCDPFPLTAAGHESLAGRFFLVSCNPDRLWNDPSAYGICLLDVFGNCVPVYEDPEISCWQARVLEPRQVPPALAGTPPDDTLGEGREAMLLLSDVYQGLEGVPRGSVKYLRVMEQVPRPWSAHLGSAPDDAAPGQMVAVSLYTHLSVKVLHGVVPVREDGSACFTVPARRNVFLQALDADFMEVQRMRTFLNLQPGERRSCVGCHERRNRAPQNRTLAAARDRPSRPVAQPGETAPRPLHYPTDIQPIFDQHCTRCHNRQKNEGHLDLTGEMTDLFCRSYENIIQKDLVAYIQEFAGTKPEALGGGGYAPAVPPYTFGSHQSRLIAVLTKPHFGVSLPREDFIRLVTWVDANAPYYGSYFGHRNLVYRGRPDFRPVPTLQSACGQRPMFARDEKNPSASR